MYDESSGGQGDVVRWSRADFTLARRAARQRWGVPDPLRTEALYQAAKTLADPEAGHREKHAASKLLLEADRHDLAEDKHVLDRAKLELLSKPPGQAEARDAWEVIAGEIDAQPPE